MSRTIRPGAAPPRISSSGKVDPDAVQRGLDDLHKRLSNVEDMCRELQQDVERLLTLVTALTATVEALAP